MEVDGGRIPRLCYCSNVHPAESIADIGTALLEHAAKVRDRLSRGGALGVGLWLPRTAVDELIDDEGALDRFRAFLAEQRFDVRTLNAFPYGGFHRKKVKEKVFSPSWAETKRLEYTRRCGEALAALLPEGASGSISTVPLGVPSVGFDRVLAVENLRSCARSFEKIEQERGRRIVLSLEPEPAALLETISDAVDFLQDEVFRGEDDPLRRWLGVCFDVCHEAVMHQDVEESLEKVAAARIVVGKLQLSSALEVPHPLENREGLERMRRFDEGRWLHQVAWRRKDGSLAQYPDIAAFNKAGDIKDELEGVEKLRVHFHVPIFADPEGSLRTTRGDVARAARTARRLELTEQFEVETYTFDVIPAAEREALGAISLADLIERELLAAAEM